MTFREKVLNNLSYTDQEWNAYLQQVHGEVSGVTRSFSQFPTTLGPSSYEVLLESAPHMPSSTYVDH